MQMFAETEKLRRSEHRAYTAEQQVAALQSNTVKLQLCIDELRMKYEPGTSLLPFLTLTGWHDRNPVIGLCE